MAYLYGQFNHLFDSRHMPLILTAKAVSKKMIADPAFSESIQDITQEISRYGPQNQYETLIPLISSKIKDAKEEAFVVKEMKDNEFRDPEYYYKSYNKKVVKVITDAVELFKKYEAKVQAEKEAALGNITKFKKFFPKG